MTTTFRIPRSARYAIRNLPARLGGMAPDPNRQAALWAACFQRALWSKIHAAFLTKSDGGTDEVGDSWKDIKPATKAYRADAPKPVYKRMSEKSNRGLLTAAQNRKWKGIFASTAARLQSTMSLPEARARAAQTAWAILKSEGAKTKLSEYGSRKVPILIVSHRLEESLRPGEVIADGYLPPDEQYSEWFAGAIEMGTHVPYAAKQHRTRRLWPGVRRMKPWINHAAQEATQELVRTLSHLP